MITKYYRLNQPLDINKVVHNIKKQIEDHCKKHNAEDTILSISVSNINHSVDFTPKIQEADPERVHRF